MGFCKENEICRPFVCRKAICSIGEELRKITIPEKCKEICVWINQGINEVNACKDPYCTIGDTIVRVRKELTQQGH